MSDRDNFKGGDHTHLKYNFYDPEALDHFVLQEVAQLRSYNRAAIIDNKLFHNGFLISSSVFQNPANHYQGTYDLFSIGDKIAYNPKAMAYYYMLYNNDAKRFVYTGEDLTGHLWDICDTLKDTRDDVKFSLGKRGWIT